MYTIEMAYAQMRSLQEQASRSRVRKSATATRRAAGTTSAGRALFRVTGKKH
ncbi:hypothetical protein GCM10023237_27070 [Streptomyces coeruleoprunus]